MNILLIFPGFIVAFIIVLLYEHKIKLIKARLICKEHNKNKVHFYVARDMNGRIFLYLGRPFRGSNEFLSNEHGNIMLNSMKKFGLNPDDFKNLKWEDEPVEVFINMED